MVTLTLNPTFIDNPKSVIMEIKAPTKYGTDFQKEDVSSKRQMGLLAKDKILLIFLLLLGILWLHSLCYVVMFHGSVAIFDILVKTELCVDTYNFYMEKC